MASKLIYAYLLYMRTNQGTIHLLMSRLDNYSSVPVLCTPSNDECVLSEMSESVDLQPPMNLGSKGFCSTSADSTYLGTSTTYLGSPHQSFIHGSFWLIARLTESPNDAGWKNIYIRTLVVNTAECST